jgi:hypothetical protein
MLTEERALLAATVGFLDEGTIIKFRGKARCKPPFLAHQLSVFFCTEKI